jgi:predicted CXXCH cytochrome family protein
MKGERWLPGRAAVLFGIVLLAACDGARGPAGPPGLDGAPAADPFPLETAGVVGLVTDRSGATVTDGIVYFVPVADVAALPATTIAVGSTNDEPLEDTIAANGATYPKATVGADGRYALPTLAAGSYFVTFVPDAADADHLPGGSLCRVAVSSADLVGTRRDLEVSSATPANAEYIGSGRCVQCHGRTSIAKTMHRLGIWSPYEQGLLQDASLRFDDLYQALVQKFDPSTTVYFYGYDGTRGFDKWKTAEADPATGACTGVNVPANCVDFTVTVRENAGAYEMVMHNVADTADPAQDRVLRVDSVYGGGVLKQRYLTKQTNASGFFYSVMPLQFQNEGSEVPLYGRTSKVWRDYNAFKWYNATTKRIVSPATKDSFEKNCMSCHAVGTQVTGSDATVWTASTITDSLWGDWDYDGDGLAEEMNLGCENCHGPGSAHWESAGQGRHIVSPSLLTPERESMICGQCHSRPKGATGTDSPMNADGRMMVAGLSRDSFLSAHATTQLDGAASDYYTDDGKHSKSHHQQYSDFIRSSMYKNGSQLMTCASCHDPHRRDNPRQLRAERDNNAGLCGECHAPQLDDLAGHMVSELGFAQDVADYKAGSGGILCTDCHMPKTAKTGSGVPGIAVDGVQYWQTDISSHVFAVPGKAWSKKTSPGLDMSTGYTKACGQVCHTAGP